MNETSADRLKQARISAKYATAEGACAAFGWKAAAYRHHEGGVRAYDVETAIRYGRAFKVSPAWLLGLTDDAGEHSAASRSARPAVAPDNDNAVPITSLDLSLSMGPGTLIEEFVESEPVMFDLRLLQVITRTPSDRLRMVRGIGDSMEPTLRTGDQVLVNINERTLGRMGIYWIDYLGAHGIKRLRPSGKGKIMVMSDNPVEPDFEADAADLRIEGRVIWFGREL